MSYQQAVDALFALGHELSHTRKFDLAHMRALLAALRNPQDSFRSVLIAGTNGKGSTAASLESIVRAAGYRTGLYTSPHLLRVNERVRVQGEQVCDDAFAGLYDEVDSAARALVQRGKLPHHPSFFEMLTAMAFLHFARSRLDLAVLEVGMGGRLDATNAVEPLLAVITDVSLDHQKFLGNTIREIAFEKAGIIRSGGVVVTLPQHPEANDAIGNTVLERGATAISAVPYVPPVSPGAGAYCEAPASQHGEPRNRYPLTVLGEQITVDSPLAGRHQYRNLALAIAAAVELTRFGFAISAHHIEQGIRVTRWPGRFQHLPAGQSFPECILDVAHNPAGAWALRSTLSERCESRPMVIVFGAMRDKDIREIAQILFPLAEYVIVTHADSPRAATPEEVAQQAGGDVLKEPSVAAALARARALSRADTLVVVTGSIYVVGEAMRILAARAFKADGGSLTA